MENDSSIDVTGETQSKISNQKYFDIIRIEQQLARIPFGGASFDTGRAMTSEPKRRREGKPHKIVRIYGLGVSSYALFIALRVIEIR